MSRCPILVVLLSAPLAAQSLQFGLKAGVPTTQYFDTGQSGGLHGSAEYSAATRRYTLGASIEWRPLRHAGLEAGALYHRMGYVGIVRFFDSANGNYRNSDIDVKGNSWDFPVLAKYRFGRAARPFVAAGGVLRYVGPVRGKGVTMSGSLVTGTSTTTPLDTTEPSELRKRFYPGLTAAAGVEFGRGRLRLVPEFRYTRWTANIGGEGALLRFHPNQAEFLAGIGF